MTNEGLVGEFCILSQRGGTAGKDEEVDKENREV